MKKTSIATIALIGLVGFSTPILAATGQAADTQNRVNLENTGHDRDSQQRISNVALTYTADGQEHVIKTHRYEQWAIPQTTTASTITIDGVTADINGHSQQVNIAQTADAHGCAPSDTVDVSTRGHIKVDHDLSGNAQYIYCPGGRS